MPSTTEPTARKSAYPWAFRARFRRGGFGWRGSRLAIGRISEAVDEVLRMQRLDPLLAAQGAVLFLQRLSPALADVDSSTGALGNAAHGAVQALVPVIAKAPATASQRVAWLESLFAALQEDDPPYIESVGEAWGELCVTEELASRWADELLPTVRRVHQDRQAGKFGWFTGTAACLSALYKAQRHDELLQVLDLNPRPSWHESVWGARVLLAKGQVEEGIAYLERRCAQQVSPGALASFAEDALLQAGQRQQAYERYALTAHQANSRLATYRSLAKAYPEIGSDQLLRDLIRSTPGEEGKWFATAKTLKRYDLALELAQVSPCDPKTLTRAARDHLTKEPEFALGAAKAALAWIATGHGYELTGLDVLEAYRHLQESARLCGQGSAVEVWLQDLLSDDKPAVVWMRRGLGMR